MVWVLIALGVIPGIFIIYSLLRVWMLKNKTILDITLQNDRLIFGSSYVLQKSFGPFKYQKRVPPNQIIITRQQEEEKIEIDHSKKEAFNIWEMHLDFRDFFAKIQIGKWTNSIIQKTSNTLK